MRGAALLGLAMAWAMAACDSGTAPALRSDESVSLTVGDDAYARSDTIHATLVNHTSLVYQAPGCVLDLQVEVTSHTWKRVNDASLGTCSASDASGHIILQPGAKIEFAIPVQAWMTPGTYRLSWLASSEPILLISRQTFLIQ